MLSAECRECKTQFRHTNIEVRIARMIANGGSCLQQVSVLGSDRKGPTSPSPSSGYTVQIDISSFFCVVVSSMYSILRGSVDSGTQLIFSVMRFKFSSSVNNIVHYRKLYNVSRQKQIQWIEYIIFISIALVIIIGITNAITTYARPATSAWS